MSTPAQSNWQPPASVAREDVLARSDAVLAKPDLPFKESEDIFRISALGLDWDMGAQVYEPTDPQRLHAARTGRRSASSSCTAARAMRSRWPLSPACSRRSSAPRPSP